MMEAITVGPLPTKNGNGVVIVFHSGETATPITMTKDAAKAIAMQLLVLIDALEKGEK